jgi:hypothetical protein
MIRIVGGMRAARLAAVDRMPANTELFARVHPFHLPDVRCVTLRAVISFATYRAVSLRCAPTVVLVTTVGAQESRIVPFALEARDRK